MKKILGFLLIAVVTAAIVVFFAANLLFAGVLSKALGVPVQVGRVQLGLSKIGIYGLNIGNPAGFEEKKLAKIPEISLEYDAGSFLKGKGHIKKIRISISEATIEKKGRQVNLLEIPAMKKPSTPEAPAETPKDQPQPEAPKKQGQPMQVQVDEVVLNLDKARYVDSGVTPPSVKEYSLGIQDESFRDVTNVPSVIKQVVFFILKKVGMSSLTSNLDVLAKGLAGEAGESLGKLMSKLKS